VSGIWQGTISRGDLHVVADASKEAEEMRTTLVASLLNALADLGVSCDIVDNDEIAQEYFSQRVTDYFERRRLVKEYLGKGPYMGEIGGVIIFWSDPPDFTAPSGELDAAQARGDILISLLGPETKNITGIRWKGGYVSFKYLVSSR
jgi:hypothetical protein